MLNLENLQQEAAVLNSVLRQKLDKKEARVYSFSFKTIMDRYNRAFKVGESAKSEDAKYFARLTLADIYKNVFGSVTNPSGKLLMGEQKELLEIACCLVLLASRGKENSADVANVISVLEHKMSSSDKAEQRRKAGYAFAELTPDGIAPRDYLMALNYALSLFPQSREYQLAASQLGVAKPFTVAPIKNAVMTKVVGEQKPRIFASGVIANNLFLTQESSFRVGTTEENDQGKKLIYDENIIPAANALIFAYLNGFQPDAPALPRYDDEEVEAQESITFGGSGAAVGGAVGIGERHTPVRPTPASPTFRRMGR
jgi:hypothetical protein